jgi:hypothetical protein
MKKTTKKVLPYIAGFWISYLVLDLPAMINPTPLSKARERFLFKTFMLGAVAVCVQIFAKE